MKAYAEAVLERFRNPFIRHELRSIALNSISKFKTRLLPLLLRYASQRGELPPLLTLAFAALLYIYRGDRVPRQDSAEVIAVFDRAWADPDSFVSSILKETTLWGTDLSEIPGLAGRLKAHIRQLEADGACAALRQLV
ncbi:Altronate oxidoreductase [compost metagenome]